MNKKLNKETPNSPALFFKTIGNFITDNTEILLSKLENHCQLDPDEESICFSCKYKAICKGGCPGYSKKCFGKFNMGDLRCPLVKESMNV